MKTLGVVTVARSDYGCYRPILKRIKADPELELEVIVSGAHLSHEFGYTIDDIRAEGYDVVECIDMLLSSDSPQGIAKSLGLSIIGFSQLFERWKPDILLILGDRFDMCAAALAALPFKIPVAHIHGGELSLGAMDDTFRHAMTKCSHLHFPSTEAYAKRLHQLGEEPWRVTVSGAPSLDNIKSMRVLSREELEVRLDISLQEPPILATYHPCTLEYEQTESQTEEWLAALDAAGIPIVFSMPNADTHGRITQQLITQFVSMHDNAWLTVNMGTEAYFSLMSHAAMMVGNSSSGIIEAPSFRLPVVNIGRRQEGRGRARNVIDVGNSRHEILDGIKKGISISFRSQLETLINPYGKGEAAQIIVEHLKSVTVDDKLLQKKFNDISLSGGGRS